MKRSGELKRTTPLVAKKPMARGSATLARSTKPSRTAKLKPSRPAKTAAEAAYLGQVAALGCAVCRRLGHGPTPAIVHHQRTGQGAMRASHYRTAPLCPPHHQHSGYGVHDMGRAEFAEHYGFSEVELVEETRVLLVVWLPADEKKSKVTAM